MGMVPAVTGRRLLNDGLAGGLWSHFAPPGLATQWYWRRKRGPLWNFLHGKGWRTA